MKGRRTWLVSLFALSLVALGAACGGDDDEGGGQAGGAPRPETLQIGLIPIADVAPVFLGVKQGFFEEQQLRLEPQFAAGGAAITPAVVSGDFDIGFSNTVSLLIAGSKDLPVQIISQGVLGGPDRSKPWADLLVAEDGPIEQPKDLEGKTIAANTLNNICEVTIKASLEEMGVDVATLKFTEVPFPDMNAALDAGRVDGACVVEPFVTQGTSGNAMGIDPFYVNTAPDLTVATYFTSKQYAEENPEVVASFQEAHARTARYIADNEAEFRDALPEISEIAPPLAEQVNLPVWREKVDPDSVERVAKAMEEQGLVDEAPDVRAAIHEGA